MLIIMGPDKMAFRNNLLSELAEIDFFTGSQKHLLENSRRTEGS
jgi:hypothetical protein